MTDKTFKELFVEDFKHIGLGLHLLKEELEQELNIDSISPTLKEKLAMLHTSTELMTKRFVPEHLEGKKNASNTNLKEANEKIRELENQIGKDISLSDIPKVLNALKEEVRLKAKELGLYCSPDINLDEYGIKIVLKYIHMEKQDSKYARDEKELSQIKNNNLKSEKMFFETFDVSEDQKGHKVKIQITSKNIDTLIKMMSNINGHSFELQEVSNDRYNDNFDIINTASFYLSTHNFVFPKMYYGEE